MHFDLLLGYNACISIDGKTFSHTYVIPDSKWAKMFVDIISKTELYGNIVDIIEKAEKENKSD